MGGGGWGWGERGGGLLPRCCSQVFGVSWKHRVDRVLGFYSSRPIGTHPPPQPTASVSPTLVSGRTHSLAGEGLVGSQFGRGNIYCGTLGIYVLSGWNIYLVPYNVYVRKALYLLSF